MRWTVVVAAMPAMIVVLAVAVRVVLTSDLHLEYSYIRTIAECNLDRQVSFHRTIGRRREKIVSQKERVLMIRL
jgi:hypothetical protein